MGEFLGAGADGSAVRGVGIGAVVVEATSQGKESILVGCGLEWEPWAGAGCCLSVKRAWGRVRSPRRGQIADSLSQRGVS